MQYDVQEVGDVKVVNATPLPITFLIRGEKVTIPRDSNPLIVMDMEVLEMVKMSDFSHPTVFLTQPYYRGKVDGWGLLEEITDREGTDILVLGSLAAAQTYGYPVVVPVSVPETKHAPIRDKIFLPDEFYCFFA